MLKKIIAFLTAAGAAYKFFPAVRRSLLNWLEDEPVKAPGKDDRDQQSQEPAEENEQPVDSESQGGTEAAEEEQENEAAPNNGAEKDTGAPGEKGQNDSKSEAEADEKEEKEASNEDDTEDKAVLIHPNRTYEEELLQIPGVGSELAASFIRERKENGNFESIDDLIRVKGIGAKKLEELRSYFTMEDA
ncbi:ComEA family DNA-binding protein [Alkalicoccus luteus]|uniref:ComEA family DNA-binding protein n=1 Tax=Alkalicoccus luteus TaxID=1237094 RepID=UPI004033DE2B